VEKTIMKMPKAEQENAYEEFNRVMDAILKADPAAVTAAMEADKLTNAEKRKAKKLPSASDRASSVKG
jgi:DNA-binding FadR family transcriptional regulator